MTLSKKAKALGDAPAYPLAVTLPNMNGPVKFPGSGEVHIVHSGLTKREAFAMAAMQGFCSTEWGDGETVVSLARFSRNQADAMLEALAAEAE